MDKLSFEIEFPVDTPRLQRESQEAKVLISGVNETAEKTAERASSRISKLMAEQAADTKRLQKNILQLKIAMESYEAIVEKATDPAIIERYNRKIQETRQQIQSLSGLGISGGRRSGFDSLQFSLQQIAREMPAFTYSIQTGFMAMANNFPILFDDIARARAQNEALTASGQKSIPVWKQVVKGLFSWGTAISLAITLITVYGKEIGEWITGLFKGKKALDELKESQETLNKALQGSEFKKATVTVAELRTTLDLAKKGMADKKAVVDQYNESIGKTAGQVTTLDEVERGLVANADSYIKMMLYKAAATIALEEAAKKAAEAQEAANKNAKEFATARDATNASLAAGALGPDLQSVDAKKYRDAIEAAGKARQAEFIKQQEKEQQFQEKIAEDLLKKAADAAGEMGGLLNMDAKAEEERRKKLEQQRQREGERTIRQRRSLLDKVAAIDAEYARKSFDKDEEELQALRDKFDKVRKEVERFNADPRNKNVRVDISFLDERQQQAEEDLIYRQQTAKLKEELEKQKQVYAEYEDYKTQFGKEAADERYKNELKGADTYLALLQQKVSENVATFDAAAWGQASGPQSERVKFIQQQVDEEKRLRDQAFTEQLAALMTYEQQRQRMIEDYQQQREQLVAKGENDAAMVLDRQFKEELAGFDDENVERLDSYKELFSGIERLSDAAARRVIANAAAMVDGLEKAGKISPELAKEIREKIRDTSEALDSRLPDRLSILANEFDSIAQSVGTLNEGLGGTLSLLSGMLKAVVQVGHGIKDLKTGIANYQANKAAGGGGFLGTISGIAGVAGPVSQIVGAVTGVVSGIVNFFKAAKESARQAAEEIRQYQEEIIRGEQEYNRLLRERERSQRSISDMTLAELEAQRALLEAQREGARLQSITVRDPNASLLRKMLGLDKRTEQRVLSDYEAALINIQNKGVQIVGKRTEKYGGFLGLGRKTRTVDVTTGLTGASYEELEQLYTEGKLTEGTRAMFENLRDAKNELGDIDQLLADIDKEFLDRMTGGVTAASISSGIIQGLKDGRRAYVDFAGDVEKIIQDAMLSAMSATVFDEPLRQLVEEFREDARDGLSQDEISRFKEGYREVVQEGIDAVKEIEKITGPIGGGGGSSTSHVGQISRTITEQSASELIGLERSAWDIRKRIGTTTEQILETEKRLLDTTLQSIRHQAAIEKNTGDTVAELRLAVTELKAIKENTQPGSTAYDRGY